MEIETDEIVVTSTDSPCSCFHESGDRVFSLMGVHADVMWSAAIVRAASHEHLCGK